MIEYKLTDINGNVLGVITLCDDTIPTLIMNDVECVLGGSFVRSKNKFVRFILLPTTIKEEIKTTPKTTSCCNAEKTRGPNNKGKMVCPIHCSKCEHDRKFETYLGFCSTCGVGDSCSKYI